jgi:hypothetical protein
VVVIEEVDMKTTSKWVESRMYSTFIEAKLIAEGHSDQQPTVEHLRCLYELYQEAMQNECELAAKVHEHDEQERRNLMTRDNYYD